jgi:hypothetical protein
MTGKELIMYILRNNLENEIVLTDGVFLGFINESEAAAKFDVGLATIKLWYVLGWINGYMIGDSIFFPKDIVDPREEREAEHKNG